MAMRRAMARGALALVLGGSGCALIADIHEGLPLEELVVPCSTLERCDPAAADEDCDGKVNEEGDGCVCGDGYLSTGEHCDDGGTVDGDSCSATCEREEATPVAGIFHTCALLHNGSVKCWGFNKHGQLGLGDSLTRGDGQGEMGKNLKVVNLGSGQTATAIAMGNGHTCALTKLREVKCWGYNNRGQLGQFDTAWRGDGPMEMGDDLSAVNLLLPSIKDIDAGIDFTCAHSDDGIVKCWGENSSGQLGVGHQNHLGDDKADKFVAVSLGGKATAISAGESHVCAILDNGSVKCWGAGDRGQLGQDDKASRGSQPSDMGDALPPINLGAGIKAIRISAGGAHTCAVLEDHSVKCWGSNSDGQLGLGLPAGEDQGDEPDEMANLPTVDLGLGPDKEVVEIAAGRYHTCALLSDGSVKCWGMNLVGQLGLGDTSSRGDGPVEMGDNLPPVNLGTDKKATAINAGHGYHTCARLNDGSVKCWGYSNAGQLGLGDFDNRGDAMDEMGDKLPTVKLFSDVW